MSLLDIKSRRGDKRPETHDEWERYEADKVARKAKNVASAREILARNGITYRDYGAVNGRVHFVIPNGNEELWYWPETGLWFDINQLRHAEHFGCKNLVRHIKGVIK